MRTFVHRTYYPSWMPSKFRFGWGNGYVVIPQGHPAHGKDFTDIKVLVHGGLTFSVNADNLQDWPSLIEEDKGCWVVGFDTSHSGDNIKNCNKKYVLAQTENLRNQLLHYKLQPMDLNFNRVPFLN